MILVPELAHWTPPHAIIRNNGPANSEFIGRNDTLRDVFWRIFEMSIFKILREEAPEMMKLRCPAPPELDIFAAAFSSPAKGRRWQLTIRRSCCSKPNARAIPQAPESRRRCAASQGIFHIWRSLYSQFIIHPKNKREHSTRHYKRSL
jgi:hypothetical protein